MGRLGSVTSLTTTPSTTPTVLITRPTVTSRAPAPTVKVPVESMLTTPTDREAIRVRATTSGPTTPGTSGAPTPARSTSPSTLSPVTTTLTTVSGREASA